MAEYSCLPRDPEVHIGVRVGDVCSADLSGESYAVGRWTFEVARQGDDWILGLSRAGRREQLAYFDKDFRAGEIVLSSAKAPHPGYPLRSPIDEWLVLHRVVAGGGLCLNATAVAEKAAAREFVSVETTPSPFRGWSTPSVSLLGRNSVWVREVGGRLCVYRTPWSDSTDRSLANVTSVVELSVFDESESPYRELLDPTEASELLVTHAVVPVCDESMLERVMHNAQRIGESARVLRLGDRKGPAAPMAWQSTQLQSGFAPPRGAI